MLSIRRLAAMPVLHCIIDVEGACLISATREQMPDGVQCHFGGEIRLLDREIPCRPDQRCGCYLMVRGTDQCDVELPRGLGRSEPIALAPMERDKVLQECAAIAVGIALDQIAPHVEPGVACDRRQTETAIGLVSLALAQNDRLAEPVDIAIAPRLLVSFQQGCGTTKRLIFAPLAEQGFGRELFVKPQVGLPQSPSKTIVGDYGVF